MEVAVGETGFVTLWYFEVGIVGQWGQMRYNGKKVWAYLFLCAVYGFFMVGLHLLSCIVAQLKVWWIFLKKINMFLNYFDVIILKIN
jgi:hypothetical protein